MLNVDYIEYKNVQGSASVTNETLSVLVKKGHANWTGAFASSPYLGRHCVDLTPRAERYCHLQQLAIAFRKGLIVPEHIGDCSRCHLHQRLQLGSLIFGKFMHRHHDTNDALHYPIMVVERVGNR